MGLSRVYPFVPRVTIKRLARDHFGYDLSQRPEVEVATEGLFLDYPKVAPELPEDAARHSILMIAIDSLRADMLAPETMPFVDATS